LQMFDLNPLLCKSFTDLLNEGTRLGPVSVYTECVALDVLFFSVVGCYLAFFDHSYASLNGNSLVCDHGTLHLSRNERKIIHVCTVCEDLGSRAKASALSDLS